MLTASAEGNSHITTSLTDDALVYTYTEDFEGDVDFDAMASYTYSLDGTLANTTTVTPAGERVTNFYRNTSNNSNNIYELTTKDKSNNVAHVDFTKAKIVDTWVSENVPSTYYWSPASA